MAKQRPLIMRWISINNLTMLQSQKNCRKVACIMTNNSGQSVFFTFSAFLNTVNWRKM